MDAKTKPDEQNAESKDEKRSYYYDDAHGYEIYRAEDEDEDEEKSEKQTE